MTRYTTTTLTDDTGTIYELDVSIETGSVCPCDGGPDHCESSKGVESARNLTTGATVGPDDLPESVWRKFDDLRIADL